MVYKYILIWLQAHSTSLMKIWKFCNVKRWSQYILTIYFCIIIIISRISHVYCLIIIAISENTSDFIKIWDESKIIVCVHYICIILFKNINRNLEPFMSRKLFPKAEEIAPERYSVFDLKILKMFSIHCYFFHFQQNCIHLLMQLPI